MGVFDALKSKLKKPEKPRSSASKKKHGVQDTKISSFTTAQNVFGKSVMASTLLRQPHISEKASNSAGTGVYIFRVFPQANKIAVKQAVEELYGVTVESVRIINTKSKTRRLGKILGNVPGYKKAMVRLASGSKIDIIAQ